MKSIIAIATLGALSQAGVRSSAPFSGIRSSEPLTGKNKHKYLQGLVENAINEDGASSSAVEAASNDGDNRERTGFFATCHSCKSKIRANNEGEDGGRRLAGSDQPDQLGMP